MAYTRTALLLSLLAIPACAADEPEADTTARGACTYPDDQTSPAPQPMQLAIEVAGTATIEGLEPECQLDGPSGSFEGLFEGEASIGEDGAFVAGMASAAATFLTPGGCEVPDLDIEALTRVSVRAALPATEANCSGYCAAGGGGGSCTATCTAEADQIVAEAELSADRIAELSARNLTGGALGEIEVDLTFDQMVDAEGVVIAQAE